VDRALKLGRRLGLILTKNQMTGDFLRDKENNNAIKEKLIQVFCRILQRENIYDDLYPGAEIFNRYTKPMTTEILEVLSP